MTAPPDSTSRRRPIWPALGALLLLLAIPLRFLPDGRSHSTFAQFLGRLHPALVHVPIALLLLVPLMELAGMFGRRAHLRAAAGFVLALATAGAVAASLDGWLLAWSGGYSGPLIVHHLWGGVALTALCLIATGLRARFAGHWAGFALLYFPLLLAIVVLMFWTSDQGGQITHGDNYLTEYMPRRLRSWFGLPPPPPPKAPPAAGDGKVRPAFYAARIAPLLERSCLSCHNPKKTKGGLLLDSYEHLMHGGEDGAVVVPWDPGQSELMRRVMLPPGDDDFMPSNGKNPLSPAEVKLLEQWIAAGASAAQPLPAAKDASPLSASP